MTGPRDYYIDFEDQDWGYFKYTPIFDKIYQKGHHIGDNFKEEEKHSEPDYTTKGHAKKEE